VTDPIVAPRYTLPCIPASPEGSAASWSGRNSIPVLASASRSSRTALVVLFSLLATVATRPALAADFGCTVTRGESDVRFTFSGGDVGRSANLRNSTRWVANVTGETSLVVADGVDETYHVVLNGFGETVPCTPTPIPTATTIPPTPTAKATQVAPAPALAPAQTSAPVGLELVWSDDFDGTAIDPTKWEVFTGNYGTPHRVQTYTNAPENVRVEKGALILEATLEDGQWYSGMVNTNDVRGPDAARWATGNLGWTFGRFEIRARIPHATGMWPALWMRPIDYTYGVNDKGKGWPLNGEIDILEYIGPDRNPESPGAPINKLIANAHWQQDGKRKQRKGTFDLGGPEAATAFVPEWHTYAVEWTPHRLEYFVDGQSYHVIENWASDTGGIGPFDQNFDIIMNLQVGGWPGDPVPSSAGSQMEIDWVRVYQDNG